MSDPDNLPEDVDARLLAGAELCSDLRGKCLFRSAMRAAQEGRRLAKAERRLMPYLLANFHVMNVAQNLFEPALGRDAAIENIALLESPERARSFQGDYDEGHYEHTVHWMSACSYDNLAIATAAAQGYNSEGMQGCIADGIGVCRRTGKLQCVACFREYATLVHRSADDLEMALHHARTNATRPGVDPDNDRRWTGACDVADLLLLGGQLEAAWEAGLRAMEMAGTYHSPMSARRRTRAILQTVAALAGRDDWAAQVATPEADVTPRGEDPLQDFREDLRDAAAAGARGDHTAAAERLTYWDKWLADHGVLHDWFETRLRLIAAHRLAGQNERAEALTKSLEKKANEAHDFLTLHRLAAMRDGSLKAAPVPAVGPYTSGPFAAAAAASPVRAAPVDAPGAPAAPRAADDEGEAGPMRPTIDALWEGVKTAMGNATESRQAPDVSGVVRDLLAVAPDSVSHPDDASRLIHLAGFVAQAPNGPEVDGRLWAWARAVARPHGQVAVVLNVLATLGDTLRGKEDAPLAEEIDPKELESLFRRSLDLDPNHARSFARAATFFLNQENFSEAERCLARGFRLDRANDFLASRLADLYAGTERPSDALAVLDMCLREGTESPDLLWQAGVLASSLEQYNAALAYLNRLEELQPGRPWVHYYRALALLGAGRPAEAAAAIEAEAPRGPSPDALHLPALRAAAAGAMNQPDRVREHARAALDVRLADIDYLSLSGITSCMTRLWNAVEASLPEDDPTRRQLEGRMLASGLMPNDYFEARRRREPTTPGLSHYVCTLRQPLDGRWEQSPARLPGTEGWAASYFQYGVLAADEAEAERRVLAVHHRLYPLPAAVESVEPTGEGYTDHPGVTWQSLPMPAEEPDGQEEPDGAAADE